MSTAFDVIDKALALGMLLMATTLTAKAGLTFRAATKNALQRVTGVSGAVALLLALAYCARAQPSPIASVIALIALVAWDLSLIYLSQGGDIFGIQVDLAHEIVEPFYPMPS